MTKPIIYIAGKVTGEPIAECSMKFRIAEQKLIIKGYDVINPIELVNDWKAPWDLAMRICIQGLCMASEVYFLNDWRQSQGAQLEHKIATALKIKIHYQK